VPEWTSDQVENGAHFDPALEASSDGTEALVEAVDALDLLPPVLWNGESVVHRDSFQHEHAIAVEHLADGVDLVSLGLDFDLTRFQRAGERAGQSAGRGGDHVVERRRVRRELVRRDPVMVGNLGVHTEHDGLLLRRQVREALRPSEALDLHS
jgi:hypothetical protein